MHDDRTQVERRITRMLDERLRPAVHRDGVPLGLESWQAPGEPVPISEGLSAHYSEAKPGQEWGPPWGTTWFRLSGSVPDPWAGLEVEAVVDLGFARTRPGFSAEALAMRPDGTPIKGLNPLSTWLPVAAPARGGEPVEVYVEAASNPDIFRSGLGTDLGDVLTAGSDPLYRVRRVDLAVFDRTMWELVNDIEVLDQLMRELSPDSPRRWQILRALERAMDALDLSDVSGSAQRMRELLAPTLASPAHAGAHIVSAVGHAHIDSAWLWPLRETVRKVARTVSSVTSLMDEHPELVFAMSSAQQWAWMKAHRPEVWARMREKFASGQLVPVGGMWVESDTNLPGGEALARQLVHGKRFFLDELGIETEEVWLPDSFGYSAALPQLVALSGSRWFLTQKISWNQTNRHPHHTFWWEGLDGTRVFTHFPPVDTYNSELSGAEMAHLVRNFSEKGVANRSLVPFGHGDGGGGPTREMLARAARLRDLEGSPRVDIEAPSDFFAKALADHADPEVWVGELYLELHRATYTTQADTKQGNRRSESLLREAELWATTASVRAGADYPAEELDRIWKTVLLNQFHDILPGSSIAWVHREARDTYLQVARDLEEIVAAAQAALAGTSTADTAVVFNAAPHERAGVPAGGAVVSGTAGRRAGTPPARVTATEHGYALDNGLVRAVLDECGLLTSVVDLSCGREVIAPNSAGNLLQLHPDVPNNWDAWDVDRFYARNVTDVTDLVSMTPVSPDPGEDTADREPVASVRVERRFGRSTITQVISLVAGSRRVDVGNDIDWQESETFLKAAFSLDVRADRSSAETQFGYVQRNTHTNTSWDVARFEICAHRYLHVGEPGYGVCVVNDSTYGHDVNRTVRPDGGTTTTVRLSLLRAPRFPDPDTDQGRHRLRYGLVVGADLLDATREGHWLNLPERSVPGDTGVEPLVSVDNEGIVVSAVKLADDAGTDPSGDVVVRLYEALGARATGHLTVNFRAGPVRITDLLERPLDDATLELDDQGRLPLMLRPFQILTLRLTHAGAA
ncbi:MAG TPA: glycoside hydrolase family 38 C-terminal domain-containing protein [Nocardioidaceae bacterium]|nr:glycoside hydrolase family 38 C-terminal domain-containing protein [Nocardioidaceae bacterium]